MVFFQALRWYTGLRLFHLICMIVKKNNYTFAQPGIQNALIRMQEIVTKLDGKYQPPVTSNSSAPLAKHLQDQNALFIQFAFR